MRLTTLAFVGFRSSTGNRMLLSFLSFLFTLAIVHPVSGDGCFVFRWDKKTDYNEPTRN
jgi:hypothetical protein